MTLLNISMTWGDILMASLVGTVIVFAALILLVFAFNLSGYISVKISKKRMNTQENETQNEVNPSEIPASEIAAISMALHFYFDNEHDNESNVITIERIERRYSPWNSKIYGLNNNLQK